MFEVVFRQYPENPYYQGFERYTVPFMAKDRTVEKHQRLPF